MRTIRFAFYISKYGDWVDKTISFFTGGPYSHVEMIFENGLSFSSSPRKGGVAFRSDIDYKVERWEYIELKVTDEEYGIIYSFCQQQVGKGYDWLGVFGFVLPMFKEEKTKWFCSEVVAAALESAFKDISLAEEKTDPTELYNFLKNYIK